MYKRQCHSLFHLSLYLSSNLSLITAKGVSILLSIASFLVASLASSSATSLPGCPTCALIHTKVTLRVFCANRFSACLVSSTSLDVISALFNASSAACESENILMYFGLTVALSLSRNLLASKIPLTSAWKTVDVSGSLLLLRNISFPVSYTHLTLPTIYSV